MHAAMRGTSASIDHTSAGGRATVKLSLTLVQPGAGASPSPDTAGAVAHGRDAALVTGVKRGSGPFGSAGGRTGFRAFTASAGASAMTRLMALTMPTYPVQRQRFPASSRRISASLACGRRRTMSYAAISMPGVQ